MEANSLFHGSSAGAKRIRAREIRPMVWNAPFAVGDGHIACRQRLALWSRSDPSVHYAMYEFKDMATLRRCLDSPGFKMLVADFDEAWPRVRRSRDLIEIVQEA